MLPSIIIRRKKKSFDIIHIHFIFRIVINNVHIQDCYKKNADANIYSNTQFITYTFFLFVI